MMTMKLACSYIEEIVSCKFLSQMREQTYSQSRHVIKPFSTQTGEMTACWLNI